MTEQLNAASLTERLCNLRNVVVVHTTQRSEGDKNISHIVSVVQDHQIRLMAFAAVTGRPKPIKERHQPGTTPL